MREPPSQTSALGNLLGRMTTSHTAQSRPLAWPLPQVTDGLSQALAVPQSQPH